MILKSYAGKRQSTALCDAIVEVVDGRRRYPLDLRIDLRNHSPTGFQWGYLGSGPAQLALAICAHTLRSDRRALAVYQRVKERLIAPIEADEFLITGEAVLACVETIEHEIAGQA